MCMGKTLCECAIKKALLIMGALQLQRKKFLGLLITSTQGETSIGQHICISWKVQTGNASAPRGIRIPVLALRGPRPWPLDDGGRAHSFYHKSNL